jgi:hypothetical protein
VIAQQRLDQAGPFAAPSSLQIELEVVRRGHHPHHLLERLVGKQREQYETANE